MSIISIETLHNLIKALATTPFDKGSSEIRSLIFSFINRSDIVPLKHTDIMYRVMFNYYYSKDNKGYKGIVNEVHKRVGTIKRTEKVINQGGITVSDFMLHKASETDTIFFDKHISIEEKSGTGDWLRSSTSHNFEDIIKEYRRKRTMIRWDYAFTIQSKRNGTEHYHIKILTSYARLFDFLTEYNGNLASWFTESSRSGDNGTTLYKMQEIATSRKKAQYLLTYSDWKKGRE